MPLTKEDINDKIASHADKTCGWVIDPDKLSAFLAEQFSHYEEEIGWCHEKIEALEGRLGALEAYDGRVDRLEALEQLAAINEKLEALKRPANVCGAVIQHTIMGPIKCANLLPCSTHDGTLDAQIRKKNRDIRSGVIPMGVSQWRAYGEKYGYDEYFKIRWPKEEEQDLI